MLTVKRLAPVVGGVLIVILLTVRLAYGNDKTMPASWISSNDISVNKQADLASSDNILGNLDCYKNEKGLCVYETNYGESDTTGSVRLRNSNSFYAVYDQIDGRKHFISIPNSDAFLTYTTDPVYGVYLYYNYSFIRSIKLIPDGTSFDYRITSPPDSEIIDTSQNKLAVDTSSISFSENAQWMVFSSPNVGMYRVNLNSMESERFAAGFDYTKGLSPSPQTAISNDGRYVVAASKDFSSFKIYDLSDCFGNNTEVCQYRDLYGLAKSQINNFYAATNIRFIDDNAFSFFASSFTGGQYSFARYLITSSGSLYRQDLLGLGDSYISGEGEYQYLPGTDTDNNRCHLSSLSYPLLTGKDLNYDSYHSVACSGATTSDLINTNLSYKSQALPHSERVEISQNDIDSILSNFTPGYIDQLEFVKQYQPKSVVLSIGGNDVDMVGKLKNCVKSGTCYNTYEDRLEFVKDVNNVFPKLVRAYHKLKSVGPPDMRIYVIAYPQIAKPGGDCAVNVHLDSDEVIFTNQAISYLNSVIKTAAYKAGVFYVDTEDAFFGHRFCEAGPGSVALNGLTAGNDIPNLLGGPIGSESFHPNTFGHKLLENDILKITHNLTATMPAAEESLDLSGLDTFDILNAPRSGRQANLPEYDPGLIPDLAYAGTTLDITSAGSQHSLAPLTSLGAELHSNPISLGLVFTDSSGDINSQLVIPANTPGGYHILHLYGKDITGQPIDIYKSIYIAKSADDLDGNGVADTQQACVGTDPSGQDYDQDGIDDSCDPNITQPEHTTSIQTVVSSSVATSSLINKGNSADKASPESDINVMSDTPRVLASSSTKDGQKNSSQNSYLYIQPKYYLASGVGFIVISSTSYYFKRWLS